MLKKIIAAVLLFVASPFLLGATTMIESSILYQMEENYIDLTKIEISIKEEDTYIPFDEAVNNLEKEMIATGETGAAKTSVYFEDGEDIQENILRVDLDFAGDTLAQPVNTMFVTDQSGSMNMIAGQTSGAVSATPCLHEEHAYKILIRIDGVLYNYYHFPSESDWTGDWYDSINGKATILKEAKNYAIKEGVATESSAVSLRYSNYFIFNISNLSHHHHYDYTGVAAQKDSARVFIDAPATDAELEKKELENESFTKIDRDIFNKTAASSLVWEFYSPVAINTSISAGEYIDSLNAAGDCYDRMNISKSIFHELSEIALTNSGNTIGYGNFAGTLHSSQDLGSVPLVDEFLNTTGTRSTHYEDGLDFAKAEFTKEGEAHSGNQNLLIFVTDGVPNGTLATPSSLDTYMTDFIKETNAIVYFIGIDIPDVNFNTFGPSIATSDSYGNENMRNSKSPDDLLSIQEELEKILTSTTNLTTSINSDFYMISDADHPVTINYTIKDSAEVHTETVDSLDELSHLGITYDKDTGAVNWNAGSRGITSARLSFYKQFDESKVDWEKIKNGETLVGTSLGASSTGYIDYSGREQEIIMDDTASYIIEKNSKLTIENTTSTPYDVEFGQEISYEITVKNTGVLTSEDNYVYQKLPEGTTYSSSLEGAYDEDAKVITYEIPSLTPGEEVVFSYVAIVDVYDFEIVSQARLGVYEETVTYDEAGIPYLVATDLVHKSAKQVFPSDPEDPTAPVIPDETQTSQTENSQQLPAGQISSATGDVILIAGLSVAGVSLVTLLIALVLRRKTI